MSFSPPHDSDDDQQDPDAANALPPRRETFLARYPRRVKLIVTLLLFTFLILPPVWIHTAAHRHAAVDAANDGGEDGHTEALEKNRGVVGTDVNAPALNDQDDRTVKLTAAPDSRVTEDSGEGSLPRIGEGGQHPWQVYARPFDTADRRPRIALVIMDLGLSRAITDQVIAHLPPTVTLAFDSQGDAVNAWCARARQEGHEVLLQVPMEPFDYPRSDPGPNTLLTSLPNTDNLSRLLLAMRRGSGYVGIASFTGSRFTSDSTKLAPVLDVLRQRGLLVLDARAAPHSAVFDLARNSGIPAAMATTRIDADLTPDAINAALSDLEKTARLTGRAIGIAAPIPALVDQIQNWTKNLPQRGIALAPVSAMVQ